LAVLFQASGRVRYAKRGFGVPEGDFPIARRDNKHPNPCSFEAQARSSPSRTLRATLTAMDDGFATGVAPPGRFPFWTLARFRGVQLRNLLDQQLREAPLRALAVLVLMVIIWAGLYEVLTLVLRQISRWELVAVVANQHVFIHFFLVLAVMLAFSNAILAFGSLFGRDEAEYLLTLPVPARPAVCLKWI
jgi:hypothetical protein